jgi:surface polysaccharide O-acyltransferase-like enzyme
MKKALLFFTLIIPFFGSLLKQNFETFDTFEDLEKELIRENDTCYVLNFGLLGVLHVLKNCLILNR